MASIPQERIFGTDFARPHLTNHRSARKTPEQWERIKNIFEALYIGDDLSLKEVMEILKTQHQFIAT